MANRDTGGNFGNTGGNQGNPGQDKSRGQTPDRGQDRERNMPGQPEKGGPQGDVRNQSELERERDKKKNQSDPTRPTSGPAEPVDSDEDV
jgi:hypothetical protein